jgi:phage recombination protein Bet
VTIAALSDAFMLHDGDRFILRSRSRPGVRYEMLVVDGHAIHLDEGCEGEVFNGPTGCWHSRESEKYMTAVTTYQPQALLATRQQFSAEDIQVIKNTICRGASDAELGMFLATCRSTGLNPFMKQIHAVMRNVNLGTRDAPKWEKQMTIVVGIDGYRVVRDRLVDAAGNSFFDGMDGPQWSNDGVNWEDAWFDTKPPKLARVAIYRKGISRPFVAQARWDAYNQKNSMWDTMGAEQLAKCAEALALRRAFPADMAALPSGSIADLEPPDLDSLPAPVANLINGPAVLDAEFGEVMASDEQQTAIKKLWNPKHSNALAIRGRYTKAFPRPGEGGAITLKWLTALEADEVIALLQPPPKPEAAVAEEACEHDYAWDEVKAALACGKCGEVLMDEAPVPEQVQAPLV